MRLVIIGCGGFIGSHLLDRLLADETVSVRGWDPQVRKITRHLDNPRLRLHRHPVHEPGRQDELRDAVRWADAVINLAAICNPAEYNTHPIEVIRAGFLDVHPLVELCAAERTWLISFSTSEVYGRTLAGYLPGNTYDDPDLYELDEDETPLIMGPVRNQRWTYACAKQMLERYIYAYHHEHGLPFTIVRPLNFFGPRMDYLPGRDGEGVPRVLACFMNALIEGRPLQLVDGGRRHRTIVSIHEAVDALLLMLARPERAQNQFFNIGNRDNEVTIAELADLMRHCYAEITGDPGYRDHPIEVIDGERFYGAGYEDCDRRMPKLDRARTLLGWTPRIGLREILLETMSSYHDQYAKSPTRP
ncbi:NAD-dependent epimerase/dehydratase family protein [Actinoplanes sp. NPDC049599]|uniref:NAD-dependent epimerase/dehydratase family protein n=1 Tax=Actinoplanes sp. NPDC049599 TaxID=3363903 RepID=UPI003787CB2D